MESFIDNRRCDHCAWPSGINPDTEEGAKLIVRRAIGGITAFDLRAAAATQKLGSEAAEMIPNIVEMLRTLGDSEEDRELYFEWFGALAAIGPSAFPAVTAITRTIPARWDDDAYSSEDSHPRYFRQNLYSCFVIPMGVKYPALASQVAALIGSLGDWTSGSVQAFGELGPAALPVVIDLFRSGRIDRKVVGWALCKVGDPAIAALRPFTGWFADAELKRHARRIIREIESDRKKANRN